MLCPYCSSGNIKKNGVRKSGGQKYYCSTCRKGFTPNARAGSPLQSSIEYRQDGSISINRLLIMTEQDALSPNRVLVVAGFDPDLWKVRNCRVNAWNAQRPKDAGQLINHQVRLDVEPKKARDLSIEDIKSFFEEYKHPGKFVAVKAKQYSLSGKLLEIMLADPHFARRYADRDAVPPEQKIIQTTEDIVSRAKGKKFRLVILAPAGDIFDADNVQGATTKGTLQNPIMAPNEMYRFGVSQLVWMIDQLRAIAPVKYIFIPGNHDELLSFALALTLEHHYRDCKDVTFLINDDSKFSWYVFGVNLIAWTHGNIPKRNIFSWLPSRARREWGDTKHAEIHSGHTNQQTVFEDVGQVVRYLPSIADASLWEDGRGYAKNLKATSSFIWDSAKGLEAQWFTNVV